ncbi:MAG: cob(I)yrinic acid a,c-diamide adenosyltransferase [Candidatus Neomarinimicrobiota bacterium]
MRITKVTTKTGDAGETGLGNGSRVSKNSLRVHTMGSIDELNSFIGWARVEANKIVDKLLDSIQQDLFNMGGELSIPDMEMNLLTDSRLQWLDDQTDDYNKKMPPLDEFILPGGNELSSRLHILRTKCREAERKLIGLSEEEFIPDLHKKYLNRLSDLFFVLARYVKSNQEIEEISWNYKK